MQDHAHLLTTARHAVTAASGVCRRVQQRLDDLRAITKDDKSPVTVADFASQAVVAKILEDTLGPAKLVGEEDADFLRDPANRAQTDAVVEAVQTYFPELDEAETLRLIDTGNADTAGDQAGGAFWTLDPIDGTKGFLRGQQYAVALGYIEGGTPTVGAMGCPNLPTDHAAPLNTPDAHGCVYLAVKGQGASQVSLQNPDADPAPITRNDLAAGGPINVCASVEKGHTNVSDEDRILERIVERTDHAVGTPVRLDSQCKYAVTARGQADAYLRLPTRPGYVERIWDHAAGAIIATEAGCTVTDIFGSSLDFGQGRGLEKNKGIVCAAPRVHALVIEAIEALGIKPA
ncbi:MAG: 3'(2'),5'-bisphosphate nucleotidase [Planctomycetota bacterium]